jgi:hypothetical protein
MGVIEQEDVEPVVDPDEVVTDPPPAVTTEPDNDKDLPEQLRGLSKSELANRLTQSNSVLQQVLAKLGAAGRTESHTPVPPAEVVLDADDLIEPTRLKGKIDQMFAAKAMPFIAQQQATAGMLMYQQARAALPHFADYEAEIIEELRSYGLPPQALSNPAAWRGAHGAVLARHIDEITDRKIAERNNKGRPMPGFRERPKGEGPEQAVMLTNEEKHNARMLGVSEQDWISYKKFVG